MEELFSIVIMIVIAVFSIAAKKNKIGTGNNPRNRQRPAMPKPSIQSFSMPKQMINENLKKEDLQPNIQRKTMIPREIIPTENRRTAERWLEGVDMIPDGMKVVTCGYCGADNLISRSIRKEEYSCYFCREEL